MRSVLQGVCAQRWAVGIGLGRCGCDSTVSANACVQRACGPMLESVVDIRFLVGSTVCADLHPDIYARPRRSMISKVGAPMSASSCTAAKQPAARRSPAKPAAERCFQRTASAATIGIRR